MKRLWMWLLLIVALPLVFDPTSAATYYVRPDGGPAPTCNGTADAPASQAPNCAWNSPMVALPPSEAPNYVHRALVKSGDTLVIDAGSYMIGFGASSASDPQICYQGASYGCVMQPVPSGVTIRGESCAKRPELWGTQGLDHIFSLDGASNVTLMCLELTDHAQCIEFYYVAANACSRNWGSNVGTWARHGIHMQDATDITLYGLDIHGLSGDGIQAGRMHGTILANYVTLRANGSAGWDGDLGGNNNQSSSDASVTIENSEVAWSACGEAYPTTTVTLCRGQNDGGYGDGIGLAETCGKWSILATSVHNNVSDGIDLLYLDPCASVFVDRVVAEFNGGNQIKTGTSGTVQNSIINSGCADWAGLPTMEQKDWCRAGGGAIDTEFSGPNQTVTLQYNTVRGSADTLIGGGMRSDGNGAYKGAGGSGKDFSDVLDAHDNIFIGDADRPWRGPDQAGDQTALGWYGSDNGPVFTVKTTNNIVWHVKNNECPATSLCVDPKLADESELTFDAVPLPGSPALDAGKSALGYDVQGQPRDAKPDIGAYEGTVLRAHLPQKED